MTCSYDRLGRQSTIVCNGMTDTLTYNLANELLGESFSGGTLNGLSVTNGYDANLRRTILSALSFGSSLSSTTYGYDNASRLSSVSDGNNNSAAYSYLDNSPLVSQLAFKQSGTTRMTTTRQNDYLNRLTQISSQPGASGLKPIAFNYSYNNANQRTRSTLADGSYWLYQYDALGQVISGCKYFYDQTPVAGQQFDYTFDTIGNRTQTQTGGDQNGMNLRTANYHANNLNQVTNRDVPGYVDIKGVGYATNAVTVNGQTAYRKWEYFRQELSVNNSSSALWTNITVAVPGQTSVTGNVYVAEEPEVFGYDADGNLTNDGHWAYTWDGENRLATMTVNTNVGPQYQLAFAYDSKGRRIQKIVSTNSVPQYTNNFVYDGWNLIAVLSPRSQLLSSYTWGNDLSGSQQDAGGVGGLVEVSCHGSSTTNCFAAYDGNGNVVALVSAADGTTLANYEYGPFGEVIRATGPMAKLNPFRFSTIYQDDESDLLMYVHRPYKASTGTWLCKDPLMEQGFNSLYGNLINKRKSNSEIANEYLAKLYSIRPYVRQKIEPLANRINWDMVSIPDDEPKQREAANLYEFANDNPINFYDSLGLNLHGSGPVDVQICFLWWHHFPAGMVLGFTPAAANCPRKSVQSCCDGANTVFDDSYLPGGGLFPGDAQSYALALSLAQVYFQSCLTLGD